MRVLQRVGPSTLGVLIQGETGVGKEVAAQRLHSSSGRSGPLEVVNFAAIPGELAESALFGHVPGAFTGAQRAHDGHFRAAHRGTLFLDEVAELALPLQAKLLRALETGTIRPVGAGRDVQVELRVVAATHVDLERAMQEGRFREDLYSRLAGVVVRLAPLRQRRRDVLPLARRFMGEGAPRWSVAFAEALVLHSWPRNVRQLRNELARILLLAEPDEVLQPSLLSVEPGPASVPAARSARPERAELERLLREHSGRVAAVARALGRDRKQVYRWLKRAGLDPDAYRG